jgi:hypothetical protein
MKASLLLILAGVIAGGSGVAYAQDASGSGGGSDASTAAPGAGSAAPAAAATPGGWLQYDSRPLTLPAGKLAVDGILPILALDVGTGTDTAVGLQVSGTYGINDKLQVGVDFGLELSPDFNASVLIGRAAYTVLHKDKMDLAVAAALSIGLDSDNVVSLELGGWFRYRVAPKMMIFTGQPTTMPIPSLGFGTGFLLGPNPYQLSIGFNDGNPIDFNLPVGFGYQATPNIWLYGQLTIFDIISAGSTTVSDFIFSDFIPLTIGGFYTINDKMEAGLSFGDDLEHAGDLYAFTLNFRYWVK